MTPASRPGHGVVVVLVVLALLVGLAVAPGMVSRVAAVHVSHGVKVSDTEWWIANEENPNHDIPDYSMNDALGLSWTEIALDTYPLRFSVGVVVDSYTTISGIKTLVFKVATGYVDTYGDWQSDYQKVPNNPIWSVKIIVSKVGAYSPSITWPVEVPANQGAHHLVNGGWDDNAIGDDAKWTLEVMLDENPDLEAIHDTGHYHYYDPTALQNLMKRSIPSENYQDSGSDQTAAASFTWMRDWYNPNPERPWREAATFNVVTLSMPSAPDVDHGVDVSVIFKWSDSVFDEGVEDFKTKTVGPIKLRMKNIAPPGTVSLDAITDADTTTTSVTLSWSQYDDVNAVYFQYYQIWYRLSGGTWQFSGTVPWIDTTSYTVPGLQEGTTYDFRVRVEDVLGQVGTPSNVQTATTDGGGGGGGGGGGYPPPVPMGDPGPGT
jgi:hypothetical protein